MKKLLNLGLLVCSFVLASLFLTACGEQMLNVNDNITASLVTLDGYFTTSVYGKNTGTDFNTNTSANYIANEDYYVLVATEVTQTIPKIKLNNITYTGGVDFSVAVGNSNVVSRVPFSVESGNFYISAPLLFLNAGTDRIVTVSFPDQKIQQFDITVFESNTLNIEVTSQNEGVLFAVSNMQYEYNFKSNVPTNSIFVVLKSGENALTTSEIVLVEKVANAGLSNQSVAYTYSNPSMPTGETQNGIQLFPGYNNGQNYTTTTPPDHKLTYNIHVPGVGSATITINFENTYVAP